MSSISVAWSLQSACVADKPKKVVIIRRRVQRDPLDRVAIPILRSVLKNEFCYAEFCDCFPYPNEDAVKEK